MIPGSRDADPHRTHFLEVLFVFLSRIPTTCLTLAGLVLAIAPPILAADHLAPPEQKAESVFHGLNGRMAVENEFGWHKMEQLLTQIYDDMNP